MALNVLVVDDSAVMRAMVIRTLNMSGVSVGEIYQAGNGQEALEIVRENWVDLALVDINMPVMNGEEMLEAVRADPLTRDLAIIIVSTESSETRIERLLGLGADFVHKPFTAEVLRKAILGLTGVSDDSTAPVGTAEGGQFDF